MSSTTLTLTTTTNNTVSKCSNPACPSTYPHNTGYFNFANFKDESTRMNKLPTDILAALKTIDTNQRAWHLINDLNLYIFLAKFAVIHQSYLPGLMPKSITEAVMWYEPAVQKILKTATRQPLNLAVTAPVPQPMEFSKPAVESIQPAVKETKKATIPGSRLKNAMGRGPIFTGKAPILTPVAEPRDA